MFWNDYIHLTKMEFILKYWYFFAIVFTVLAVMVIGDKIYKKKHPTKPFNLFKGENTNGR